MAVSQIRKQLLLQLFNSMTRNYYSLLDHYPKISQKGRVSQENLSSIRVAGTRWAFNSVQKMRLQTVPFSITDVWAVESYLVNAAEEKEILSFQQKSIWRTKFNQTDSFKPASKPASKTCLTAQIQLIL